MMNTFQHYIREYDKEIYILKFIQPISSSYHISFLSTSIVWPEVNAINIVYIGQKQLKFDLFLGLSTFLRIIKMFDTKTVYFGR